MLVLYLEDIIFSCTCCTRLMERVYLMFSVDLLDVMLCYV